MALSGKNSRNNHLPVAVVKSAFKNNKLKSNNTVEIQFFLKILLVD
jgi:hypothetical protein